MAVTWVERVCRLVEVRGERGGEKTDMEGIGIRVKWVI